MSTKDIGNTGEDLATQYLLKQGFLLLERNWKTRYCEIDIIAKKDATVYFVEVKTRKNDHFGSGLDYITPKKLQQMSFAANLWVSAQNWQGQQTLAAISITNDTGKIEFTEVL